MWCEGEVRRTREVRVKFEPSRIERRCLVQAYEQAVPIVRRPTAVALVKGSVGVFRMTSGLRGARGRES